MVEIIVIGVTGKTGCGKSEISAYFEKKLESSKKIDVDMLAKKIYIKYPDAFDRAVECFGNKICKNEKEIDFALLGKIVFSSFRQMKKLNNIMFPLIKKELSDEIKKNANLNYLIIDAAVLFDAEIDELCDIIINVKSYLKNRNNFLKNSRPSLCSEDISERIKKQKIKIIKEKVDFTVNNNSTIDNLQKQADRIIQSIKKKK